MTRYCLLCLLLCAVLQPSQAQTTDALPSSPAYKGEIRRGADGKLIVLEDTFHGDDQLKTNLAQYAKNKGIELRTA